MLNLYIQTRWGGRIPEGPYYGNLEESASHRCLLLRGSAPKSSRIVPEKPGDEPKIAENIISWIFENVTFSIFCQWNNPFSNHFSKWSPPCESFRHYLEDSNRNFLRLTCKIFCFIENVEFIHTNSLRWPDSRRAVLREFWRRVLRTTVCFCAAARRKAPE